MNREGIVKKVEQQIEIKEQINDLLKNMKLPVEIRNVIKNIYKGYEDAYNKFLSELKEKNIINSTEIDKIEIYIKNDCKENIQITELVGFEEYEQKRIMVMEVINEILKRDKETIKSISKIDDSNKNEKENKRTSAMIIDTAISEIISSKRNIMNKVNKLKKENEGLEQIVKQFDEELKNIIVYAKQQVPQITDILSAHYQEIYTILNEIVERHNKTVANDKEKDLKDTRREQFLKRIVSHEELKMPEINNSRKSEILDEIER